MARPHCDIVAAQRLSYLVRRRGAANEPLQRPVVDLSLAQEVEPGPSAQLSREQAYAHRLAGRMTASQVAGHRQRRDYPAHPHQFTHGGKSKTLAQVRRAEYTPCPAPAISRPCRRRACRYSQAKRRRARRRRPSLRGPAGHGDAVSPQCPGWCRSRSTVAVARVLGMSSSNPDRCRFELMASSGVRRRRRPGGIVPRRPRCLLLYWQQAVTGQNFYAAADISLPAAVTVFPDEYVTAPRSWTEQAYHNLIYFHQPGGEQRDVQVDEVHRPGERGDLIGDPQLEVRGPPRLFFQDDGVMLESDWQRHPLVVCRWFCRPSGPCEPGSGLAIVVPPFRACVNVPASAVRHEVAQWRRPARCGARRAEPGSTANLVPVCLIPATWPMPTASRRGAAASQAPVLSAALAAADLERDDDLGNAAEQGEEPYPQQQERPAGGEPLLEAQKPSKSSRMPGQHAQPPGAVDVPGHRRR